MSDITPKEILNLLQGLPKESQDALVRQLRESRKTAKAGLAPNIQELSTAISRAELRRQMILEEEIKPLEEELRTLGLRRLGPTPAHRWVESKLAGYRTEWRKLPKPEKKAQADAKRREVRESDEFARLFPAEAYKARKEAGVEPLIADRDSIGPPTIFEKE